MRCCPQLLRATASGDVRVVEAIVQLNSTVRGLRLEVMGIEQEMHENDALARRYADEQDVGRVEHHVHLLMRGEAERGRALGALRNALGMLGTLGEALRNYATLHALQTTSITLGQLVEATPDATILMDRIRDQAFVVDEQSVTLATPIVDVDARARARQFLEKRAMELDLPPVPSEPVQATAQARIAVEAIAIKME